MNKQSPFTVFIFDTLPNALPNNKLNFIVKCYNYFFEVKMFLN